MAVSRPCVPARDGRALSAPRSPERPHLWRAEDMARCTRAWSPCRTAELTASIPQGHGGRPSAPGSWGSGSLC